MIRLPSADTSMQSGPAGAGKSATTARRVLSIWLMVLATRLLTSTWRRSPSARNACAPLPVGTWPTALGAWPVASSNTCTPSPPVRPSSRWRSSGVT